MRHDTTTGNGRSDAGLDRCGKRATVRLSGNTALAQGAHAPHRPHADDAILSIITNAARPSPALRLKKLNSFADGVAQASRLVPLYAREITDESRRGRARILSKMAWTLRNLRIKARTGHWDYQPSRHAQIANLYHEMRAIHATL